MSWTVNTLYAMFVNTIHPFNPDSHVFHRYVNSVLRAKSFTHDAYLRSYSFYYNALVTDG